MTNSAENMNLSQAAVLGLQTRGCSDGRGWFDGSVLPQQSPQAAHGQEGKAPVLLLLPANNSGWGSLKAGVHLAGHSAWAVLSLQNELTCY